MNSKTKVFKENKSNIKSKIENVLLEYRETKANFG